MNNMERCKQREAAIPVSRLHELFYANPHIGTLVWKAKGGRGCASHFALQPAGGGSPSGYLRVGVDGGLIHIHRVMWAMHHGRWPDGELDHINRDKLDNRVDNLREASRAENQRNTDARANNTSGIKGVTWDKKGGKWRAQITVGGKSRNLGHFTDIDHAQMVRRIAEHVFFGGIHAFPEDEELSPS